MGLSIESPVHSNSTSPVIENAGAGAGWEERKVVKRKPSINVYFTAPLMRDAVRRGICGAGSPPKRMHSCDGVPRNNQTFTLIVSALSAMFFIHRACSSHISRFHVALMLILFPYSLDILAVFLGIVVHFSHLDSCTISTRS